MRFAGADDGYDEADYVVAGYPLDATASFRKGTRFAPSRVREASRSLETYVREADRDVRNIPFYDYGDIDAWNDARETVEFGQGVVAELSDDAKTPIIVGGEHTVSVAGFRGTDASSVVIFDAHLDLKEEFEGSAYSHACVARRAVEDGRDVYIVGAREASRDEWGYAEESRNVHLRSFDRLMPAEFDAPYVSVDLDVLDPGYAPGVGTPVPRGVSTDVLFDAVRSLAPRAVGFDTVEACPAYGAGEAEFVTASLVRDFVAFASDGD
ncbi:agmatinase [Haladaptatus sp. F3-133]|jgi:agmatinase|uniref:Agmatinase n=1 Tax=Halorutilus salinus TaxID=2487751 RepID=A0A9Q4GHW8_9EURY|nr:agmatinase [Halorutilus salinus]MCX2819245.1 agmatinase [Halorutilus salinus]